MAAASSAPVSTSIMSFLVFIFEGVKCSGSSFLFHLIQKEITILGKNKNFMGKVKFLPYQVSNTNTHDNVAKYEKYGYLHNNQKLSSCIPCIPIRFTFFHIFSFLGTYHRYNKVGMLHGSLNVIFHSLWFRLFSKCSSSG